MKAIKIIRNSFKKLRRDNLTIFAEKVVQNCQANPVFAMLQPQVTQLEADTAEYRAALVAAESGAYSDRARKRIALSRLVDTLDGIAKSLEFYATDEKFVIDAGFKVGNRHKPFSSVIPAPLLMRVQPTGNEGEVRLYVQIADPDLVQTNAVEFSADGGISWHNGAYRRGRKLLITGLPSGMEVQFRVRSIGTFRRISTWSGVVGQTVL